MTPGAVRVYARVFGNTMSSHIPFLDDLVSSPHLQKVNSESESDVTIAFVPVVSRAGTDITAALKQIPETRRVVLVVLHHTFDPYFVAPDSGSCVSRSDVFTVDCLFHEDEGLLNCERNAEALNAVKQHLRAAEQHQPRRSSAFEEERAPHQPAGPDKVKQFCLQYKWVLLIIPFMILLLVVLALLLRML